MTITIEGLYYNNVLNIILYYLDYNSYTNFYEALSISKHKDIIIENFNKYIISKNNICLLLNELLNNKLTKRNYICYYSYLFNMLNSESLLNKPNKYGIKKPQDIISASIYYIYILNNKKMPKGFVNITSKLKQAFWCLTSEQLLDYKDKDKYAEFKEKCINILSVYKCDKNNINKLFKGFLNI